MSDLRRAGALLFCAALFAPVAFAHAPVPGMEGFYRGLAQPFTEPAQGLAIAAAGGLIGRAEPDAILRAFGGMLGAAALALIATGLGVGEPILALPNLLLGLALVCGAVLALLPQVPSGVVIVLSVLAGLVTGANALPEPGEGLVVTSAGSLVGLTVLLAYVAGAVAWLKGKEGDRPVLRTGVRVAGSWIAAIAILLLAFAIRGAEPAAETETAYCTTQPPSICMSAPFT